MKREAVAVIDEARCIGCTLCIDACPVDAIVGARGWMHTVVEHWCIGCDLCLPPCPVDCIEMRPVDAPWTAADAALARRHAQARKRRIAEREAPPLPGPDARRATLDEALERARARRAAKRGDAA